MPIDYSKYPDNWKEIRQSILERANHCCEGSPDYPDCRVANYATGTRDCDGQWHDEDDIHKMNSDCGYHLFGDFPKMTKIILTVAHLDHDTSNNKPDNLRAWCQRCHLNYDKELHQRRAAKTRALRGGQLELINAT